MGFLDYLDNIESTEPEVVVEQKEEIKQVPKKAKILSINVEVRTVGGARLVIEKLQEWITRQEGTTKKTKKPFRIPPKKVITNSEVPKPRNKIQEANAHAMDILEGLPDAPEPNTTPMPMMVEGHPVAPQMQQPQIQPDLDSVSGYASALL